MHSLTPAPAVLLCVAAALAAYLLAGINPAIILSRRLFHADIRHFGSRNPGFTNFLRHFGDAAWVIFVVDIAKGFLLSFLTGLLYRRFFGLFHLGAACACLAAMLGHAYPVWYGFRGGKSVAVFAGAIWCVDWRVGLVAAAVLFTMLAVKRYMSLAVLCASGVTPFALLFWGMEHPGVWILNFLSVALLFWRHRDNIRRLRQGTENRFSLRPKKK